MKQDEIIEMAIKAEFVSHGKPSEEDSELFVCTDKDILRFAKLVAERALADPMQEVQRLGQEIEQEPPQRTWVGLTVDELITLEQKHIRHKDLSRAIEAKIKENNTPQRTERNFCERCGKRIKDLTHIHTCTPPKD